MNEIVSVDWLYEHLGEKNLLILDASMNKISESNSVNLELETIPNSLFFDINTHFSDPKSDFPNTLLSPTLFEVECRKLGINNSSKIVVFDNLGVYSSPRVWWMFRTMGFQNIAVLDGGLPQWKKHNYPVEIRKKMGKREGDFTASFNPDFVIDYTQIQENIESKYFMLVDARSAGRFLGTQNEPRKELKSGNIPNSINIPFEEVLQHGKFKTHKELTRLFEEKATSADTLVFSCGSGLTACIVLVANRIIGWNNLAVYDGSWCEWAEKNQLKN